MRKQKQQPHQLCCERILHLENEVVGLAQCQLEETLPSSPMDTYLKSVQSALHIPPLFMPNLTFPNPCPEMLQFKNCSNSYTCRLDFLAFLISKLRCESASNPVQHDTDIYAPSLENSMDIPNIGQGEGKLYEAELLFWAHTFNQKHIPLELFLQWLTEDSRTRLPGFAFSFWSCLIWGR